MKKTLSLIAMGMLLLASCSTPSSAVRQLSSLTDDVRTNSSTYTLREWKQTINRYETVNTKIEKYALRGKYTPQQMEEIGRLQGECAGEMVKGAGRNVMDKANTIGSNIKGIVDGLRSALGF